MNQPSRASDRQPSPEFVNPEQLPEAAVERRLFIVGSDGIADDVHYKVYSTPVYPSLDQTSSQADAKVLQLFPPLKSEAGLTQDDDYSELRQIFREDLAESENISKTTAASSADTDVARPVNIKNIAPKSVDVDAFKQFFASSEEEEFNKEARTEKLRKLGKRVLSIGDKINDRFDGLVRPDEFKPSGKPGRYEAKHAAEKRYKTTARKVGRSLLKLPRATGGWIDEKLKVDDAIEMPVRSRNKIENELHMFDADLELPNKVAQQFEMFNDDLGVVISQGVLRIKEPELSPVRWHEPASPADASNFLIDMFPPEFPPDAKTGKIAKAS